MQCRRCGPCRTKRGLCWAHGRVVRKRMNGSTCRLGSRFAWAEIKTRALVGFLHRRWFTPMSANCKAYQILLDAERVQIRYLEISDRTPEYERHCVSVATIVAAMFLHGPSRLIFGCLQTFTENSLLYPEFLLALFLLLLVRASLTL